MEVVYLFRNIPEKQTSQGDTGALYRASKMNAAPIFMNGTSMRRELNHSLQQKQQSQAA
jgi:hypothetical protein